MSEHKTRRGWIFPVIAGVVLAASVGSLAYQSSAHEQEHAQHEALHHKLEEQVKTLTARQQDAGALASAVGAGVPSADPELALGRIESDTASIEKLLKMMFVWDSHESYESARQDLVRVYGVPADDALLTTFLAPGPVSEDANGVEYPYIDAAGLSSSLGAFEVTPTGVRGVEYSYLVLVSATSSSTDGSTDATRTSLLEVTTDASGEIISIQASAAPSATRASD